MQLSSLIKFRFVTAFLYLAIVLTLKFYLALDIYFLQLVILIFLIPLFSVLLNNSNKVIKQESLITGIILIIDTLILTGIIYYLGGPSNPLSIFYLVSVVLSVILLNKYWTWSIYVLSSLCFLALFFWQVEIPEISHHEHHNHSANNSYSLHLQGMYIAYLLVGALITYFLTNLLAEYNLQKNALKELSAKQERLVALTTLSASTAHNLGTPLATINLVATEILNDLKNNDFDQQQVKEDLSLISSESLKCKQIIGNLCNSAGSLTAEKNIQISFKSLQEIIQNEFKEDIEVNLDVNLANKLINIPINNFKLAIFGLIKNAIEASNESKTKELVKLEISEEKDNFVFTIIDKACGLPKNVQNMFGEPFITTKKNGKGMGLGIFIAKLVAESLGGGLEYEKNQAIGTKIYFSFKNQEYNK